MTTDNLFSERQHFRQVWLWVLMIILNGIFIYGFISQLFFGHIFGLKPMSNGQPAFATIAVVLLTLLFAFMRLETLIKQDGIYYRFFPFQITMKKISWDRISKAYVRQYRPLWEYGGWGIRAGLFGSGWAFNVSGNKGLQLVYDSGKKFLLGTQRPQVIERVLKQLGRFTAGTDA